MAEDFEDLDRLLAGEKAAWDRFVTRYARVIFAAVHRRLGPAGRGGEVEDVVQEVYLRLCQDGFRRLASYDPAQARLSTWLTVVATRIAIDQLRRGKPPATALDQVPEGLLKVDPVLYERVKIPEGLLTPRQALVLELLYRQEMEVAEAARVLEVDPQTVRSTHHKALIRLRAHFAGEES